MQNIRLFIFLFIGFLSSELSAQRYFSATEEEFGTNRIQTKRFDWLTIRTANFEVNYYRGGEPLALKSAKMLEGEYKRITDILGYTPFSVMKVFIYASPRDLEQSNMGLLTNNFCCNSGVVAMCGIKSTNRPSSGMWSFRLGCGQSVPHSTRSGKVSTNFLANGTTSW